MKKQPKNDTISSKVFSFRTSDEKTISALGRIQKKNEKISDVMSQYFNGELVSLDDIESKIKYQKYLKLCLENWNTLKHNGNLFEEAKLIITEQKNLEAPSLNLLTSKNINTGNGGLDEVGYCNGCNHLHYGDEPRRCKNANCNCGVRG